MNSTSESLAKAKSTEEKGLAKATKSRGMSAKACSAKAMTWKLETTNALPKREGSISGASSS